MQMIDDDVDPALEEDSASESDSEGEQAHAAGPSVLGMPPLRPMESPQGQAPEQAVSTDMVC